MPESQLLAGVSRVVINPPKGIYLIGYGDRSKGNTGIHDDLTATALVFDNGKKKLAFVACDLLCLNEFIVDRIRDAVGQEIEVLLCCSHTHSGPIGYADHQSGRRERDYIDDLVRWISGAVLEGSRNVQPVRLAWSRATSDIAVNRREKLKDGKMIIGENPGGIADRSVLVLSVMGQEGRRLATLVNFACHGTVWGPDNLKVSADWIGVMRAKVENVLGGKALFLQGATGDLNPRMGWGREDCWQMAVEQGERVAEVVISACQGTQKPLRGHELEIARREIWLPFEVKAESDTPPTIYRKRILAMANLPEWLSFITDYLLNIRYPWKSCIDAREGFWATPLRINAARIDHFSLVTFGCETFTGIGMKVKAMSPGGFTMFASITDGCIGYLPTDEAHEEGGYEVDLAPYAYRFPGPFATGAEKKALDAVAHALNEVWQRQGK